MKYAMLFPGQGSQSVGMLGPLSQEAPQVAQTFDEAGAALGWDVGKLVREGPADELNRTERTQPALLAAGIAVWRVWQARGVPPPVAMAGHSLGEYSALVAAGAIAFADALKLVELRGQLMQQAMPPGSGGMAAVVGLDDEGIARLCGAYTGGEMLEPANFNAPGQVVLAGTSGALKWVEAHAREHGARMVVRLPVSVPSHCSAMKTAALTMAGRMTAVSFHTPAIPVLHNLDAAVHPSAPALKAALREQLYKPVRWTQTIQGLRQQGAQLFLECGPGRVLSGLNKRILDKDAQSFALEDAAALEQAAQRIEGKS
ncbi:MAG TPA: ACP S-malonyltransferase [Candidatus Binatia bacterium]|nr:ACP S-malonyltransferase [Candidatus Binatia bacterium]